MYKIKNSRSRLFIFLFLSLFVLSASARNVFNPHHLNNENFHSKNNTIDVVSPSEYLCELDYSCPEAGPFTYSCIDEVPAADYSLIEFLDFCDTPIITHVDVVEGEGCLESPLTIERTYTIIHLDEVETCTQIFIVIDTEAPIIEDVPVNVTIDCTEELPTDLPNVFDNCDESPSITEELVYGLSNSDDDCQLRTQTQGGWGSPANGNNPGVYRDANFADAFPEGLVVGCDYTLTLSSASAVQEFLPSGGTPNPLTEDLYDPNGYNVFAGQIVALALSLGFDDNDPDFGSSSQSLASLTINNGVFNGLTVGEFFEIANQVFGGCSDDYSSSEVANTLAMINENFVDGEANLGDLDCNSEENICEYSILRIFTATDNCGNSSQAQQLITVVDNTPPVIEPIEAIISVECDDEVTLEIVAYDDCSEVTITYEDIDISDESCYGAYQRTWYVTDECGNTSSATQTVQFIDETPPTIFGVGDDMTLQCDEEYSIPEVTAEDNCSSDLSISFSESIVDGDCSNSYEIIWTWTATDECGNIGMASKVLTIIDTTPPIINIEDGEFEIPCDESPELPEFSATDNCTDAESITLDMTETTTPGTCGGEWVITRIYQALDLCGNVTEVTQVFYGIDNVAPVFESYGEDQVISCDDIIPDPQWEVTDNCSDNVNVTIAEETISTDCPSEYVIMRYYTAIDECENLKEEVQIITIEDNTPPVFNTYPEDIEINCGEDIPEPEEVTATDNCDDDLVVTLEISSDGGVSDPDALTFCEANDPIEQDGPLWSLVLFEMPNGTEYYTTIEANWVTYEDEGLGQTAHLFGSVVSSNNENAGWDFDVWFYNGEGWIDWQNEDFLTSYKDDQDIAGLNYLNWTYYLVNADSSSMTGWGDYEGSFMSISHNPANFYYGFQEGVAANNVGPGYGVGGWIHYEGQFIDSANDVDEFVSGGGDFAFTLNCCPTTQIIYTWSVTDCAGNYSEYSQTISTTDLSSDTADELTMNNCSADFDQNGSVDMIDFIMLSNDFGCQDNCGCDLDQDGRVNALDLIIFSSLFGTDCSN